MTTEKRLGFIGIIIDDRGASSGQVNEILSQFADLILARTGIPRIKGNTCVISLVVDATTDELGTLTGKLGSINGASVKSGLSKNNKSDHYESIQFKVY
jgi:putative iron-only hydrogenase system regulator